QRVLSGHAGAAPGPDATVLYHHERPPVMNGFTGLSALFINTSLEKRPEDSHTRLLLGASAGIMKKHGVAVEFLHLASHEVPPGVYPDMTKRGWARDEWPGIWEKVKA